MSENLHARLSVWIVGWFEFDAVHTDAREKLFDGANEIACHTTRTHTRRQFNDTLVLAYAPSVKSGPMIMPSI